MSLRSMTGFGRARARGDGVVVEVELVSLNRRQLDLQVTLPRMYAALEPRVRERIQDRLHRGRVTATVGVMFSKATGREAVRIDEVLARAGVDAARAAARRLGMRDDLGASLLLQMPGWLVTRPPGGDPEHAWPVTVRALDRALRGLDRMRLAEGRALARDLLGRLGGIEGAVKTITARAPEVPRRVRARVEARLREWGLAASVPDDRLLREVALMAERADIGEEVARLESHLAQARARIRGSGPCGRTLDFLAQEMGRELNTIGAKAGDARIAAAGVEARAELERFREQVQNVE